ncbi:MULTISPECIES: DUF4248 domain-containing protein [Bacteroides]|uniref:DUF4248 domain-containing protein n=1 Tax=Bacteroides TaxID=816 RepID=UPI0004B589CE|nr:DUF4248 domain-containing protein [Bacteroides neonati]
MQKNQEEFIIRAYTKAELAHLYNPTLCLKGALQVMRRWIIQNKKLCGELEELGYQARNRILTPRHVETIVRYLGTP